MRAFVLFLVLLPGAAAQQSDWSAVEQVLGRAGTLAGGVYKVSFPRTDLDVRVGKTRVEPGAGLGTWMAFRRAGDGVVADGDLVVTAAELGPVTSALLDGGLEISAIHNHLAGEQPAVYYVHFFHQGELRRALESLRAALKATATPVGPATPSEARPPYNRKDIERVLGAEGSARGKVLGFTFPRKHPIRMHQHELPAAMGMATVINFQPSPAGVAATGDFVLRETEVPQIVRHLRRNGVLLTALHNHLLDDEPPMAFLHFWVEGEPEQVARTLKRALELLD